MVANTTVAENQESLSKGDASKAIITVVGCDTVGIIAKVTSHAANHNVNILNISQTIVDGFFNMMMIVDVATMDCEFGEFADGLESLGTEIGVRIRCQRSNIFTAMHRI
ncbi:ACT domain-containing protein [Bifidobacteriaceae bacterium NR002]|nr:ACT domain-containing protein [Bifidobacteriaceae bacterium NR002]MDZ7549974.1 ACT domain-containing protein [Bifidobacteriaceae bacterium NR047]